MCTVSYVHQPDGYAFHSNRDEVYSRAADGVIEERISGTLIRYPRDPLATGSWIYIRPEDQILCCLLNGARVKHDRQPPYRMSRGIVLRDALLADDFDPWVEAYDFQNIEPFTLIRIDSRSTINELIWDGSQVEHQLLNTDRAHLWNSSTLYSATLHDQKTEAFNQMLAAQGIDTSPQRIYRWHDAQRYENAVSTMPHPDLRTLSITQVILDQEKMTLRWQSVYPREANSV